MERVKKGEGIHKVYMYFLVRVLPILIIPVFVMVAIYYRSIEVINQQTYEKKFSGFTEQC